ncbi:MAG: cyclase family protein [Flavobacterium sp.]|nr:cyclase family protein [Flavobacterium sp.]
MKYGILLTGILLASCSQKQPQQPNFDNVKWVDLTYSFDSTTLYWPNNLTKFVHHTDADGLTPLGYYYSSYSICTPEHGGTHLDAPKHFAQNKLSVDQLPMSSLTGNAVVIDVSKNALANRDYQISIADIENWEREHETIEPNTILLFKTGYGKFYPNRKNYFGSPKTGVEAIAELHFPGIDPKTASWMVKERRVKAVGLDTPSLDYGQSKDFKTHQILLGNNKPGFENVAHLDKLPATGVYVVALPMKIGQGSGAPLRIIAAMID